MPDRELEEARAIADSVLRCDPADAEPREKLWADYAKVLARAFLALDRENERLREYVYAHTLIEKGVVDFDLHAQTVERFRRAQDACAEIARKALAEQEPAQKAGGE